MSSPASLPALLFDLDGTLLNTALDLQGALNHCLKLAGRTPVSLQDLEHMVGQGAKVLLERGLNATGELLEGEAFDNLMAEFFDYYGKHLADESYPYPGVLEALDKLDKDGFLMAVCTNKPVGFADDIIDQYDLRKYFPIVTGGDSFEIRKPDPAHVTRTLDMITPARTAGIMIGDTHNDIDAGRAAGMKTIAVSFGFSMTPASELGADKVIDHFDELIPAIYELINA
ncbi:MAG: phosphoglycolate phosphatase [Sneathiella sp.]|nr:phosphoglycolate phosphatase [Sneathiella sp.]